MITPIELHGKTFKSGIGYDRREVDTFLKEVASGYEKLYKENIELKDKSNVLNDRIQYYKTVEETLQKTLLYAEKAAEDIRNAATAEAKSIQREATLNANKILSDASYERDSIHLKTMSLVRQFEQYKAQYKQILAAQAELISSDLCNLELSDYDISDLWNKVETKETLAVAEDEKEEEVETTRSITEMGEPKTPVPVAPVPVTSTTDVEPVASMNPETIMPAESTIPVNNMEVKSIEVINPEEMVSSNHDYEKNDTLLEVDNTESYGTSQGASVSETEVNAEFTPIVPKRELSEEEEKEKLANMLKEITGSVGFSSSTNESAANKKEVDASDTAEDFDMDAFEFIDTEKDLM